MDDMTTVLALTLLVSPLAWMIARRFRHAAWGQAWFLAERRFVLGRYRHTRDGRHYDPARNPEVARILGEVPATTKARTE